MNALNLIWKRWLAQPSSWVFLALCIAAIGAFGFQLQQQSKPAMTFTIAAVDQDLTDASKDFLDRLHQHDLITLHRLPLPEAQKLFKRGQAIALLEVPPGCFQDLTKNKLNLTYRAYDGAAPALADIIAQALMPAIGEARLNSATTRYLSEAWLPSAKGHYANYLADHPTTFTANIRAISALKGLTGDVQQQLILTANQSLGYGILLILLLITRQQGYAAAQNSNVTTRLKTIPGQYAAVRMSQCFFDALIAAIPWTFLVWVASFFIQLKPALTVMLWFFGLLLFVLYRWFVTAVYRCFFGARDARAMENNYLVELVVLSIIIGPGMMGGAIFPVDWLPDDIRNFMGWNPFFAINTLYYALVEKGHGHVVLPIFMVLVAAIGTGKFFLLLSKNGIKMFR